MVLQFVTNWSKEICAIRGVLIILASLMLFAGCSGSPNYEKQFSKILDDEACHGCFTDEQFEKIFEIIESDSRTFEYDFMCKNTLDEYTQCNVSYMRFVESSDKMVRAYILESQGFQGNPSHGFDTRTLVQFRVGDNIYTYRMPDTYSVIERIVKLDDNQYLFLAYYGNMAQGQHNNHQARVYQLYESGIYQNHRAFEKNNHLDNEIEVYWEGRINPVDDSDLNFDEDELYFGIFYNEYDGTMYVANTKIIEDDYSKLEVLDGTFRRYSWDGDRFRDVTIMNPYEVKNKDYYIRIEQNKDGSCTYKCWNGGIKSGKPSLTIYGGTRELWYELGFMNYDEWISLDAYQPLGERYTFTNNGYVYQYMTGWYKGHMYEDLEVYNPKGNIVYSNEFNRTDFEL